MHRIWSSLRAPAPLVVWKAGFVFAAVLLAVQVALFLLVRNEFDRIAANDILSAFSSLAAALGMAYGAAWSARLDRALSRAWQLFVVAMTFWAIGDFLWAYYELVLFEVPYPSIADVFYLAIYPCFLIGILRLPRTNSMHRHAPWMALDLLIVMFSAIGIYWNFIIGPSIIGEQLSWVEVLVNSAYPVGDVLLILVITLVIFLPRSPLWRNPIWLMLAGHGASAIGDSIFAFQSINQVYESGAFFNILFSIGPLILMLSGLAQAALAHQIMAREKTLPVAHESPQSTWVRLTIPFAWLLFAFLLITLGASSKQAMNPAQFSIWLGGLIIMLGARQVLYARDNSRLASELRGTNDHLERRVAERSRDLLLANSDLRREMEERGRIELMLREREQKLAHFALHDALTGLPNRALLADRLSQAIQRHHRHLDELYAVLFMDLDGFKVVNDSLGHLAGDQLLVQVAQRLSSIVRAEDTVARLGGDEFVLLLEGFQESAQASTMADRILDALRDPFHLADKPIYVSASIGLVLAEQNYSGPVDVLRNADVAMYEAKLKGKGRAVVFSPDLHLNAINRLTLDSDLHQALRLNQFVLHYQPVVCLQTGQIVSFEALIRWRHPIRGLVEPAEFIPVAEGSRIILPLTRWTLATACGQLAEWKRALPADMPLSISVNISPHALRVRELSEWVAESLAESGLPARALVLEVVESALIEDAEVAQRAFGELRALGVEVSLDDFGVGYSSLGYIDQYPIDELKIDKSFVRRLTQAREVDAIVRAVNTLARELDINVVAEGIENPAQLEFLRQVGCQYGQGFLLHKPMEPGAVLPLLMRESAATSV